MKMYPCNLQKYTFPNFSPVLCKGVLQIMQEACHVQEVRKTQHFHAPQPKQKKEERHAVPLSLSKNYPNAPVSAIIEETGVFTWKAGEKMHGMSQSS